MGDLNTVETIFQKDENICEWPEEEAERVKLFQSEGRDCYLERSQAEQRTCSLRFDKKRRLLKVVGDACDDENILDVIDPKDIVGVNVEIKWKDESNVFSAERNGNEHLSESRKQVELFQKYLKPSIKNEPLSEVPVDTLAYAVLSIFVYPRRRTCDKGSIFRFCGARRNNSRSLTGEVLCYDGKVRHRDNSSSMTMNSFGYRYHHHRQFTVVPVEDFTDLSIMVNAIRSLSRSITLLKTKATINNEERILVIVNPTSGKKLGVQIYNTTLRPMLEQAGIAYDCLITTHAQHARERMKKQKNTSDFRDIVEYTGIVLVGGDGIIHEVMQGIHRRVDRDEILERVKFGAIAAGTSNGLAASLAHASKAKQSPLDSAFMIVKGISSKVDLSRYETKSNSYTSFLTFSWAMIADIDIESECIRWAGFLRMDIWGVVRLLFLRKYRAKFSYIPASEGNEAKRMPPLSEPIPDSKEWVKCEDDFILFWASQMTHAGEQMFNAPSCRINDGIFHIMIVRGNVSRLRLALILLSMEDGGHIDMIGVEFIKCFAYRLEPITKGSFNDLDGEVIEDGAIQAAISKPSLRAYCDPRPM